MLMMTLLALWVTVSQARRAMIHQLLCIFQKRILEEQEAALAYERALPRLDEPFHPRYWALPYHGDFR